MPMDLQTVIDHLEINAVLNRYATAMDRQDWELLRTVYTADAHIDYATVGGPAGPIDEVLAWVASTMPAFPDSQHLVSNVDIDVSGDTAAVRAGYFCQMRTVTGAQFFCGGWYTHRMVRTPGGWRSDHMVDSLSWSDRQEEALATLASTD
jgi:3-phenylpropionate/cinnamic acid dioxygenase small subunit